MSYNIIKALHMTCVALSYALFFLRGIWSLNDSSQLQRRWVKVVPHLVDTALLASAITLAVMLGLSPLSAPWLLAKIIALIFYVGLGTIAIKRGKTRQVKLIAWISAQLVFFYIVASAITHNPLPWLSFA